LSDLSLRKIDFLESPSFTPQQSPCKKRVRSPIIEAQGRQAHLHELSFNDDHSAVAGLIRPDDQQHQHMKEVDMYGVRPEGIEDSSHQLQAPSQSSSSAVPTAKLPRRKLSPKPKRKRKKSPSPPSIHSIPSDPSEEEDLFTWHDHEITGHLMQDADDDGYGINGIGFRPTAALAYARSQRRKQQVEEWRARESKDARQMRSQRRRKVDGESSGTPSFTDVPSNDSESVEGVTNKRRSVRFA